MSAQNYWESAWIRDCAGKPTSSEYQLPKCSKSYSRPKMGCRYSNNENIHQNSNDSEVWGWLQQPISTSCNTSNSSSWDLPWLSKNHTNGNWTWCLPTCFTVDNKMKVDLPSKLAKEDLAGVLRCELFEMLNDRYREYTKIYTDGSAAVSYTHLDVYKRQE